MSQKETFMLKYPIEVDSIETNTLCLRRITVNDLEAIENEKSERKQTIKLLARISGVPEKSIKTMDVYDFNRITEKVLDFLGATPQESDVS
ncbi:MAG: phage tail assembly protein [Endozoicomonas sp. (ex Botrylloides leachii)]|nr:phage tail assembly protein [Endozoicomonas sp. (ex Botrylloides leachii)]